MALTSNFQNGAPGWRPVNYANSVTMSVIQNGPSGNAYFGSGFLRASTSIEGGSVAIDSASTYGDTAGTSAIAVFAWVRAPDLLSVGA